MQVKANFSETDAGALRTGDRARITIDALPDDVVHGSIVSIDPIEDSSNGVVTYTVTLVLDGRPNGLRSGMNATVRVEVGRADGAVTVPRTAVRSPSGASPSVIVVGADGSRRTRQVETGVVSGTRVEITSGLRPGERVLSLVTAPVERSAS
jgi:multidrug efflux pump subunit AcrA (membrane-fusion protein)